MVYETQDEAYISRPDDSVYGCKWGKVACM